MTPLAFLALGASIGLVAGLSPGPVMTLVIAETLRGGRLRGSAVAAGPLLADGPIIVLALILMGRLPPMFAPVVSLAGGVFLLYLAATTLIASRRARQVVSQRVRARGGLATGLLARALSPHPYLFWFLVGAPLLLEAQHTDVWAGPAFLVSYYLTIVGSNVALAVLLHRWLRAMSERAYRLLLAIGSAVLAVFGLSLLGRATAPNQ